MCKDLKDGFTHRLLVDDMIAVASAKPKEIIIHSLPRIGKGRAAFDEVIIQAIESGTGRSPRLCLPRVRLCDRAEE